MFPMRHLFFFRDMFWLKVEVKKEIVTTLITKRKQKKLGLNHIKETYVEEGSWYGWEGDKGGKNNQKMYMYEMPENKINFKKKKKK